MAKNSVAANLLMLVFIIGGLFMARTVKQEVFPEFSIDEIQVLVAYPGASPAEVEQGVVIAMEEAVRALDGVKQVIGACSEGSGIVRVQLLADADAEQALSDVRGAIDRIRSLPVEIERPVVRLIKTRQRSISVAVYGDLNHEALRHQAEMVRAGLVSNTLITQATLSGVPTREIAIEVSEEKLRQYKLSLDEISRRVRNASVESPSGRIRSRNGELLIRTDERRNLGEEFGSVLLSSRPDGSQVRVRDVAVVKDGFEEDAAETLYNGLPAVTMDIYRVGNQTPLEISRAVKDFLSQFPRPDGVKTDSFDDRSEAFVGRLNLLKKNAISGLILVFIVLALFLEIRLSFWVMLGIPISFLGAFLFMKGFDASINMVSMFAFILVLGIVVDDAIIVGENIYEKRSEGMSPVDAAIYGAQEVATPVIFAIATTVATFGPLLFVPGFSGKIFGVIPVVVIAVLFLSLIESLFILPAHLAHLETKTPHYLSVFSIPQKKVAGALRAFVNTCYKPVAVLSAKHRYTTLAIALCTLIIAAGAIKGGFFKFGFLPRLQSDVVRATVRLPVGAPLSDSKRYRDLLLDHGKKTLAAFSPDGKNHRAIIASAGGTTGGGGGPRGGLTSSGTNLAEVKIVLTPLAERSFSTGEFAKAWRKKVGELVGVENLSFRYGFGGARGDAIDIQLSHQDSATLENTAEMIADHLKSFAGVTDIDPGFSLGKEQLNLKLNAFGRALGLTERDLAIQLRSAFFGSEALRQQRGRDEVRVFVRRPRSDRDSRATLDGMTVRTPGGADVPLRRVTSHRMGRAYSEIYRRDGQRVISVTADIVEKQGNANEILSKLKGGYLDDLVKATPGLSYSLEGQRRDQSDSLGALGKNFIFALFIIYGLLAVPFRSYTQPLVVMSAIPFGMAGALAGHQLMGFNLSIISMLGIVALSGVVVNDSLLLIVTANRMREAGKSAMEAIVDSGIRRFRPILLTSLTTALGLAPMILETSVQARFLIPMAVSLGFGILWATVIVLVFVPSFYLILEDAKRAIAWIWSSPVKGQPLDPLASQDS